MDRGQRWADFERVWPGVSRRINAMLAVRRVPVCLREELIQETAFRLLSVWPFVRRREELWPLAATIARNLLVDHHREASRVELCDGVGEDLVSEDQVERIAEARFDLREVARAMAALNPRHRNLLIAEATPTSATIGRSTAAEKMARSRARAQLRRQLQRGCEFVVAPIQAFRRLNARLSNRFVTIGHDTAILNLMQLALCAVVLTSGMATEEDLRSQMSPRMRATSKALVTPHSRDEGDGWRGSRTESAAVHATASAASASRSDRSSRQPGGPGHLRALPGSRGETTHRGEFGPKGYDLEGSGGGTLLGKKVRWRYRHSFRARECVQGALSSGTTSGCKDRHRPRGEVEAEFDGHRVRAAYGTP